MKYVDWSKCFARGSPRIGGGVDATLGPYSRTESRVNGAASARRAGAPAAAPDELRSWRRAQVWSLRYFDRGAHVARERLWKRASGRSRRRRDDACLTIAGRDNFSCERAERDDEPAADHTNESGAPAEAGYDAAAAGGKLAPGRHTDRTDARAEGRRAVAVHDPRDEPCRQAH